MSNNKKVRNVSIAQDRVAGLSQTDIAKKHGISQMQVSRILSSDEAKAIIQTGIQEQICMIPEANEVVRSSMSDPDDGKLRLDAAKTVLKNTGITPSHTAISIDKLLIDNRSQEKTLIDGLQEFMAYKYRDEDDKKVIDVTPDKKRLEEGKDKTTE